MTPSPPSELPHPQPRKRRKIALACDQCRLRKSRCDGVKPVCGECSHRRQQRNPCRYNLEHQKDPERDKYVDTLLTRIQHLEEEAALLKANARHPLASEPDQTNRGISEAKTSTRFFATAHDDDPALLSVDAMGANSIMSQDGLDDTRYYGSSSAVALMQHVYSTINDGLLTTPTPDGSQAHSKPSPSKPKLMSSQDLQAAKLVSRSVMDKTLNCYWEKIYHLYPFLHKPSFMAAYLKLWEPDPSEGANNVSSRGLGGSSTYGHRSAVFHCALNLMLALATQFMDLPLDIRQSLERVFADKAKSLCQVDLFDDGSLAVIQTLLLMTQFLQSTPHPNRCWNCLGIACRMAQALGLYIENPRTTDTLSLLDIELRRRAWHSCVMLDAVVGMTLGRPLILHRYRSLPLPHLISDEQLYCQNVPVDPPGPIFIHFFIQSLQLYQILADILARLYEGDPAATHESGNTARPDTFAHLDFVLEYDDKITAFESQIPQHLYWKDRQSLPPKVLAVNMFEQQSSVLLVRYLHLRVLLYRPVFTNFCQHVRRHNVFAARSEQPLPRASDISLKVSLPLAIACVESSILLIEQVHLRATSSATGAWWYNLFYARTAGMVILLSMVCEPVVTSITLARLQQAWSTCQTALASMQKFSGAVGRCLQGLENLHEHILAFLERDELRSKDTDVSTTIPSGAVGHSDQTQSGPWDTAFIPLPTDIFGDPDDFDWPGPEVSFLDDVFAFPELHVS
ncbi:hypothetical protein B0A52_02564 [Exophiala mesophila]|uniref:Zn(2)-C6 fungal-type domain-containing protein n=1 Tax=Exophiala mesophila TaxID=212818 RepID=A0A438ND06_EXOME|nr:hypothetical protein B0A52_02564 [Exophiala mesophila]